MSLKKKREKRNINAHISQLSCTLVCLEPTALFWDNIRGFNQNTRCSVEDSFIEFFRVALPNPPFISTIGFTMCMWKVRILHRVCYVSVSASCDSLFIPLSDDTLELKQTEKQARKKPFWSLIKNFVFI